MKELDKELDATEQESDVMLPPDDSATQPSDTETTAASQVETERKLYISICSYIVGKDVPAAAAEINKTRWKAHTRGYYTGAEAIDYITVKGYAYSNVFHNNHRDTTEFDKGNQFKLDFDNEDPNNRFSLADALADPFIQKYAWLVYNSPNHQKPKKKGKRTLPPDDRFRVVFVADKVYDAAEDYRAMILALLAKYPQADQVNKDPARLFFGTINAESVHVIGKTFTEEARNECFNAKHNPPPRHRMTTIRPEQRPSGSVVTDDDTMASAVDYTTLGFLDSSKEYMRIIRHENILAGEGRHFAIMSMAGLLKEKGIDKETVRLHMHNVGLELMDIEPGTEDDAHIDKCVDDVFDNYPDTPPKTKQETVEEVNQTYALAKIGNGVAILDETDNESVRFMRVSAWQTFMANRFVIEQKPTDNGGTKIIKKPVAQIWLQHEKRREYENVVFKIGSKTTGYNLWRGFGGPPAVEGSWKWIEYHIKEIVCGNNPLTYEYQIQWLAHLIQKPWEKPGVAIVMRGLRGVGKGTFANDIVRPLVGNRSFIGVEKPEHLTGRFNQHLAHAVVVFADEAFFAGDIRSQKAINNFITEPRILLEPKGIDVFEVDSYHRVIMASNADWIINAGKNERRFLLLDISSKHMQDPKYFTPLVENIKIELPAFRYYLEHLDISQFDPRNAPKTQALQEQIAFSGDIFERWCQEVKDRRKITLRMSNTFGDTEEPIVDWDSDQLVGSKDAVYNSFRQFAQDQKDPRPISNVQFGIRLMKLQLPNGKPWVNKGRRRTTSGIEYTYEFNKGKNRLV